MAKNNMGIADAEFIFAANYIGSYASRLVNVIEEYQTIVNKICELAIQDQQICSKLASLTEQVGKLAEPLKQISEDTASSCKDFVDAIDSADTFLY